MKLLFLGTTGYHPSNRRQTACLMLPELGVVLDAGTGMFRVREHLCTPTLDIFLSHAHLDHVIGLTYLFDILWQRDVRQVRVHGEADKLVAIEEHLFAEPLFPARPPFEMLPLTEPVSIGGSGTLSFFPLRHPGGATGFRLDWPERSLAYVTDTTADPAAGYVQQIRGVDLLVHECYFPDCAAELAQKTGHSCTTAVAETARAAAVGRLMLVHMNPLDESADPIGLKTAQAIFPATALAEDGQELEF